MMSSMYCSITFSLVCRRKPCWLKVVRLNDPRHQVGLGDKGDENAPKDSLWGDASALASAIGVGSHYSLGAASAWSRRLVV